MKRFISIILSCSLICSNAFATRTDDVNGVTNDIIIEKTDIAATEDTAATTETETETETEITSESSDDNVDIAESTETNISNTKETIKTPLATTKSKKISAPLKWGLVSSGGAVGLGGIIGAIVWGILHNREKHPILCSANNEELRVEYDDGAVKYQVRHTDMTDTPTSSADVGRSSIPSAQRTGDPLIDDNRAKNTRGVPYNGVPLEPPPHVMLTAAQFKQYLGKNPNAPILFRGVCGTDIDQYQHNFATLGLCISSTGQASGLNAYGDNKELGRPVYFANCPKYSFRYAIEKDGCPIVLPATPGKHSVFLATFIPKCHKRHVPCYETVYTGYPSENENFVLCSDCYVFELPPKTQANDSDFMQFTNYSALTPYASAVRKVIRGFQIWLLKLGIVIIYKYCSDLICEYNPRNASYLLAQLGQF